MHDQRLHIGIVTTAYAPTHDGFATYARDLALSLVALGQRVTVVCAERHAQVSPKYWEDTDAGVCVVRLASQLTAYEELLRLTTGLTQIACSRKIYSALRHYHERTPFDVIEFSNWHAPAAFHSMWKLAPQVIRVSTTLRQVVSPRGKHVGLGASPTERKALSRLDALEAFCLRRSDLIIAPNHGHWHLVSNGYGRSLGRRHRVEIIPLGINLAHAKSTASRAPADGDCKILFVGRLTHRKGIDVLCNALPEIIAGSRKRVRVTIIGEDVMEADGSSRFHNALSSLDYGVTQHVEYIGTVSDQGRDERYQEAHIFVGPSRYESFGLMYVEAMAYGLPVVGSRIGGIPEVIEDRVTGILVEPGDAHELAAAIVTLINNDDMRRRLGEAARASAIRQFSRETMASSMLEAYRSVVHRPNYARRMRSLFARTTL